VRTLMTIKNKNSHILNIRRWVKTAQWPLKQTNKNKIPSFHPPYCKQSINQHWLCINDIPSKAKSGIILVHKSIHESSFRLYSNYYRVDISHSTTLFYQYFSAVHGTKSNHIIKRYRQGATICGSGADKISSGPQNEVRSS
jgi:hypothetical protein